MRNETKNSTFKPCIYLLTTAGNSLSYCINYHEWASNCPNQCGFFKEGVVGQLEKVKLKKYNPECLYFSRTNLTAVIFQCTLFNQENPFCESCQFVKVE